MVADFNSSNVALPFDPSRVRPELVGFFCSIPSRAARRGEGLLPRELSEKFARLISKRRNLAPGAEPTPQLHRLADVPRISGAGRFEGNRTAKNYSLILRESAFFLKQIWRHWQR